VLSSSGAAETLITQFVGGKNIITTTGLLGQSVVSTNREDYVVGSTWNEISDFEDETIGLTTDGKMSYTLPQSQTQNWQPSSVNGAEGVWLRLRIISVTAAVNPIVDTLLISAGKQYLMERIVQGRTVADNPLGSSNGSNNQEFLLTYKPLIEGSLTTEVDEGSGFEEWTKRSNFLNSTEISKDYTAETSGLDVTTVKFGDNTNGKVPVPGVDNIRSIYRIGADQDGNVGANTIKVNKSGISFVNRLFNPRQAAGWTPKEGSTEQDFARLKIEGPASIRNLGRAVTPSDTADLATQFTDENGSKIVARAKAIEEMFGPKTIGLIVVGQGGILLTEAQRESINNYFNGNEELDIEGIIVSNQQVVTINYIPNVIDVQMVVLGGNAVQIRNAVTALLNPSAVYPDTVIKRWNFGDEVPTSVIADSAFEVDRINVKKVTLIDPAVDIQLGAIQLPLAGNVQVTVIPPG
jgi:hypothetical protein